MRLPPPLFLLGDLIYAIPGISLLFFLSFWFGDQFRELVERFEDEVARLKPLIILAVLVAVGVYFVIHFLHRPVSTGDPKEVPLGEQMAATIQTVEKKIPLLKGLAGPLEENPAPSPDVETRGVRVLGPSGEIHGPGGEIRGPSPADGADRVSQPPANS
jgi:hypothetical protein